MSVWEQRQYDAPLVGRQTRQGHERQPSVAAHSIWEALYNQNFVIIGLSVWILFDIFDDFWGASTSQVIGARNEWVWMKMMTKWYSGTLGHKSSRHLPYGWGKPRKTRTQETCPDRDRTRARCVTSAHATTWSTAVDDIVWGSTFYKHTHTHTQREMHAHTHTHRDHFLSLLPAEKLKLD